MSQKTGKLALVPKSFNDIVDLCIVLTTGNKQVGSNIPFTKFINIIFQRFIIMLIRIYRQISSTETISLYILSGINLSVQN